MSESAAVTLMLCLLSALTHLHRLGVVHRDVKAENILLISSKAVLSDLEIAAFLTDEEDMQRRVGAPGYAPPEVVTDLPYDEKVDVFAAGAVLYFALSNTLAFPGKTLKRVLELTARCKVSYDPNLFGHYDDSTMQLLKALLQKDPNKRPSSKKSFIGLWAVAKPDVRNSSACKAAYQAVQECDQMAAHSAGLPKSQSRLAPDAAGAVTPRKVVRTSSATDVTKAAAAAAALDPERGTGEGSERSPRAPAAAPEASMAWKPRPPSAPKPPGSFSFLRGFGMGRNSGKDEQKEFLEMADDELWSKMDITGSGRRNAFVSASQAFEVTVVLLSGESCHCICQDSKTVQDLKEEAEQKLGRKIQHLALDTNTLREHFTLEGEGILHGATLNAVCVGDTPSDTDPPISHPPENGQKEFNQSGIILRMPQSIYDEFDPRVEILEGWQDLKGILSLQDVLPAGHMVLSPLLRLTPENVTFPVPMEVKISVCVGASNAWRSTSSGWEKVEASFGDGFATVVLTHFCDLVVSGARRAIMALGFIKQDEPAAKVAVTHVGCPSCTAMLEEYRKEEWSLGAFSCCGAAAELGAYKDDEILDIQVPGGPPSQIKLRFERLPRISRKWAIQSADSFNAEINDELFDFLLTSPAQPTQSTAATASRASPAVAAVVPPVAASSSLQPASGHQAQVVPSAAASSGAAGSGSPAPAAVPATPETAPEWHVLLSGRFKSDDFSSCEQIKDYMGAVKRRLEARGIPAFMVEARLSQSFAELTRLGLGRAKGMVAFCTSEYGAYTGVGYETFCELEFAYDKKLPIFPIKLCEDWPPAPKDNEKGIWQNKLIFTNGRLYIEDKQMQDAEGMADKIADDIEQLRLFS